MTMVAYEGEERPELNLEEEESEENSDEDPFEEIIKAMKKEIDDGKHPDFGIFHGLFTYIDRFLDRFHHPKENHYLFPKLLARAPGSESIRATAAPRPATSRVSW